MRFLITGNTGFKGSWLTVLLKELGHEVYGIALPAPNESLFNKANLKKHLNKQYYTDIRNRVKLKKIIEKTQPEILIHLAAQPIVGASYVIPRETFEVNVMGTLNVLEGTRKLESLKKTIIVTTDKVYRNVEKSEPYIESDPLGGFDPYSASKAMADILAQSWALSFANTPVLIARAGNVIGGGDFSSERIVPDLFRAYATKNVLEIRHPNAVRPWQHVLDCLNGYLNLAMSSNLIDSASAWNFGPDPSSFKTVEDLLNEVRIERGWSVKIKKSSQIKFHESNTLTLNSSKSMHSLNWKNKLDFKDSVQWTVEWYENYLNYSNTFDITLEQVRRFLSKSK